jgi:hypothetical protein
MLSNKKPIYIYSYHQYDLCLLNIHLARIADMRVSDFCQIKNLFRAPVRVQLQPNLRKTSGEGTTVFAQYAQCMHTRVSSYFRFDHAEDKASDSGPSNDDPFSISQTTVETSPCFSSRMAFASSLRNELNKEDPLTLRSGLTGQLLEHFSLGQSSCKAERTRIRQLITGCSQAFVGCMADSTFGRCFNRACACGLHF